MKLVDLQKAFDTSEHGVLLEKMKYFGFRTSVIKCLSPIFQKKGSWFVIMFFLRLEHYARCTIMLCSCIVTRNKPWLGNIAHDKNGLGKGH